MKTRYFSLLILAAALALPAHAATYGKINGSGGGGSGTVTSVTSTGSTMTITNPTGPAVNVDISQAAARAPDWFGYMAVYFQQQTGLAPLAFSCMLEKDFADGNLTAAQQGMQISGTGSAYTYSQTPSGAIKCAGPSSGSGYCDWANSPQGASSWPNIPNVRTKRWITAFRATVGKTPTSGSSVNFGLYAGSTYVGLGYVGAQTNWQYVRGSTPANITDTGSAISVDSTGGTGYRTMFVANLDLSHVTYNIDVLGGAANVNVEAITNIPSSAAYPYVYNEGAGAGDIYYLDKVIVCVEL